MKIAGTFDGKEYWTRCPFCGDSQQHPDRAHFSFQLTGLYHCYRCKASGIFSPAEISSKLPAMLKASNGPPLTAEERKDVDLELLGSLLLPGPGTSRYTALPRKHVTLQDGKLFDVFLMRELSGQLTGYHIRHPATHFIKTVGRSGFGYAAEVRFHSPSLRVRIVEGPYDIIEPELDLCTFGLPTKTQLSKLAGLGLILCPDGDIWNSPALFSAYFKQILKADVFILAIEIIRDKDPEEVPPDQREVVQGPLLKLLPQLSSRFFEDISHELTKSLLDSRRSSWKRENYT